MTRERWNLFMNTNSPDETLTEDEIAQGWHFCWEYDGLLIGPGMKELECCKCLDKNHTAYKHPFNKD